MKLYTSWTTFLPVYWIIIKTRFFQLRIPNRRIVRWRRRVHPFRRPIPSRLSWRGEWKLPTTRIGSSAPSATRWWAFGTCRSTRITILPANFRSSRTSWTSKGCTTRRRSSRTLLRLLTASWDTSVYAPLPTTWPEVQTSLLDSPPRKRPLWNADLRTKTGVRRVFCLLKGKRSRTHLPRRTVRPLKRRVSKNFCRSESLDKNLLFFDTPGVQYLILIFFVSPVCCFEVSVQI